MQKDLMTLDWAILVTYFVIVSTYGWWIYNNKRKAAASTKGYFTKQPPQYWATKTSFTQPIRTAKAVLRFHF